MSKKFKCNLDLASEVSVDDFLTSNLDPAAKLMTTGDISQHKAPKVETSPKSSTSRNAVSKTQDARIIKTTDQDFISDPWIMKGIRLRRSQMRILQAEADRLQDRDPGRGNLSLLIRDILHRESLKIRS